MGDLRLNNNSYSGYGTGVLMLNGICYTATKEGVRPTSNLWGGLQMAIDILKAALSASSAANDYVNLTGAYSMDGVTVIDDIFEEDTQYTFILAYENNQVYGGDKITPNLMITYTDGTSNIFDISGTANTKFTHAFVSEAGKTIARLRCCYQYGTAKIYYDESGVFEGVKNVSDFEPYNRYNM